MGAVTRLQPGTEGVALGKAVAAYLATLKASGRAGLLGPLRAIVAPVRWYSQRAPTP